MDDDLRVRASAVITLTDAFCAEHMTGGYAAVCRELVGRLAWQAPSPLGTGTPQAWAAGVVLAAARHVYDHGGRPWDVAAELAYVALPEAA